MKDIGILRGYPRIREQFGQIADYVALVRPFTLVAPFLVGIFGSLLAIQSGMAYSFLTILFVAVTLSLSQAVGQCLNQAVGIEEDRINKPYRPLPSGKLTEKEAYGLAVILAIIAIWRAFKVSLVFGLGILLLLLFAVLYNTNIRKTLGINLLVMAVSRGFLPILIIWSAYHKPPFGGLPTYIALFAFLWVVAWQPTKDLKDVAGDQQCGIRTLPVVYGVENTRQWIKWTSLLPFALLTGLLVSGILSLPCAILFILLGFRVIGLRGLDKEVEGMENTQAWIVFYLGLGCIYILFLIAELF